MWWKRKKFRSLKFTMFKWIVAVIGVLAVSAILLFWMTFEDTLMFDIAKKKISRELAVTGKDLTDKIEKRYPTTDPLGHDIPYTSGTRGNGVNLLLMNNIKTQGYIKELLELYRDTTEGKITNSKVHLPLTSYLGMQANEGGTYSTGSSLRLPKSYLPWDSSKREVIWGVKYNNVPADAMKLRGLTSDYVGKSGGVPNNVDRSNSVYTNVFQINRNYTIPPAKINGFGKSSGRRGDVYYLPDSISYVDNQVSNMAKRFGLESTDPLLVAGVYSIFHNGGEGHLYRNASTGVSSDSKIRIPSSSGSGELSPEFEKLTTAIPKDIKSGVAKYPKTPGRYKGSSVAAFILLEQGYYLTPNGLDRLMNGTSGQQAVDAWKAMYGESLSVSALKEKLRSKYVRNSLASAYPDYITSSEASRIYGDLDDSKGTIFKLDTETSFVYKNKKGGKDPRVLHRTNIEVIGHVFDTMFSGDQVYGDMLKLAGVDIDPTNPQDYMDKIENEFVPPSSEFADIMNKIGAGNLDKRVYDMFKWGYDRSGFWYYLGGQGKAVAAENYAAHYDIGIRAAPDYDSRGSQYRTKLQYLNNLLYATKDGSTPSSKTKNSNLINFGKILFDCSTFTAGAYNNTIGKLTGTSIPSLANAQRTSSQLRTISDWSTKKAGDIFVSRTHVFFYVSTHKGSYTELNVQESKVERPQAARPGYIWVLEAPSSNKKVGIRVRATVSSNTYTLRRFKTLE